ncbi:hypothetical protein FHR84_003542 [Actinopolyspora biskrensis]|uniref:DUF397 domain-containing protein n=1 Tax=Actinopolyspora biskrensis TaxID=1470178 RepID=A0A852ZDY0_9ACTN|nr:DUF397 domain-containing protein [Actinopolyspora biskrensis]NYH80193.1 hypothetical protein [Actinopolyspora biskrensis]
MFDTGWTKSSYSAAAGDNCVEVRLTATGVGVRDSENPDEAVRTFSGATWKSCVDGIRAGRFADTSRHGCPGW